VKLHLTKRICAEIRPRLRERTDAGLWRDLLGRPPPYAALLQIAKALDDSDETSRGEVRIDVTTWPPSYVVVLRDILRDARACCPQMQIRKALQLRIDRLDEHVGTSAVERLARLS